MNLLHPYPAIFIIVFIRNQLSTFDAEFKFAKIQKITCLVGGGMEDGVGGTNFKSLMLTSNLLKSKIPMSSGGEGGGRGWWNQLSIFDAEFKFAKIQNSHVGRGGWWTQLSTFDAEFKFAKIQSSHDQWEGGGVLVEPTFNF